MMASWSLAETPARASRETTAATATRRRLGKQPEKDHCMRYYIIATITKWIGSRAADQIEEVAEEYYSDTLPEDYEALRMASHDLHDVTYDQLVQMADSRVDVCYSISAYDIHDGIECVDDDSDYDADEPIKGCSAWRSKLVADLIG